MAINTRIMAADYEYLCPLDLDEALTLLAANEGTRVLAGGTDLLVKLKCDEEPGIRYMLDIKRLGGLADVTLTADGALSIGPLTKLSGLEKNENISSRYPALQAAIKLMAAISIRNMGTMGGNLCNASPAADTALPAICYGARLKLQSAVGSREVPAEEFFLAPGVSALAKDELLTDIILPAPDSDSGGSFIKKTRVRPDIAKLSVCVVLSRAGSTIRRCRIALGALAPTPLYLKAISEELAGQEFTSALADKIAARAAAAISPISDLRSTAEYRRAVTETVLAEALKQAWVNAGGEC